MVPTHTWLSFLDVAEGGDGRRSQRELSYFSCMIRIAEVGETTE
jgi:hypothetical protein